MMVADGLRKMLRGYGWISLVGIGTFAIVRGSSSAGRLD
jgi:hypothetical protein